MHLNTTILRTICCSCGVAGSKRLASGNARRHAPRLSQRVRFPALSVRPFHSDGNPPSKNPFEIHIHPGDVDRMFPSTLKNEEGATELEDEIQLLHAGKASVIVRSGECVSVTMLANVDRLFVVIEMAGIFGEELEEYDGSGSVDESSTTSTSASSTTGAAESVRVENFPESTRYSGKLSFTEDRSFRKRIAKRDTALESQSQAPQLREEPPLAETLPLRRIPQLRSENPSVLLVQGPCSYVRNESIR